MNRASSSEQAESIQKDALISTLKKELYELEDHKHQFIALNDEITSLQSKQALLADDKERIAKEYKFKNDLNRKNIAELRSEIDNTKILIHKRSVNMDQILRSNAGVKRVCENREAQISSLMAANRDLESKNVQIIQENKNTVNKIKNFKEERNRNQLESQRLQLALEDGILTLKGLEKEARTHESSNSKLQSILMLAQKDYQGLIAERKDQDEKVILSNKRLEQWTLQSEELEQKIRQLEKEFNKNEEQYRLVSESLQATISKNKELAKRLKALQVNLRVAENSLDGSILQRDALQTEHQNVANEHNILNSEIDKVLLQIIEHEKYNRELQREVEHYIDCDQQARNILNRREAMKNMLNMVNNKLNKTGEHIAHLRR